MAEVTEVTAIQDPPSLAFRCPKCHFDAPQEDVEHNASTDRWFVCPSCGHQWSVSPIADDN